jgi:hypothetical protein
MPRFFVRFYRSLERERKEERELFIYFPPTLLSLSKVTENK